LPPGRAGGGSWRLDTVHRCGHSPPGRAGGEAPSDRPRRCVDSWLGVATKCVVTAGQVHGADVAVVDDEPAGMGAGSGGACVPGVDGLVTNRAGVALMAFTADCPLVLVYDPGGGAVGLVHSGWRGTLGGIVRRVVDRLCLTYGSLPERMVATICPSAGPCCYEVGVDVVERTRERWPEGARFLLRRDGRLFLDLWSAISAQLQAAGLGPERIESPGLCSICDDRFHSYRRTGAGTAHGRLMAVMTG